jgi:hypothetical protein
MLPFYAGIGLEGLFPFLPVRKNSRSPAIMGSIRTVKG